MNKICIKVMFNHFITNIFFKKQKPLHLINKSEKQKVTNKKNSFLPLFIFLFSSISIEIYAQQNNLIDIKVLEKYRTTNQFNEMLFQNQKKKVRAIDKRVIAHSAFELNINNNHHSYGMDSTIYRYSGTRGSDWSTGNWSLTDIFAPIFNINPGITLYQYDSSVVFNKSDTIPISNPLINNYKTLNTYDANNNITQSINYLWDGVSFILQNKMISTFDTNNNNIENYSFSWNINTNQWDSTWKSYNLYDLNNNNVNHQEYSMNNNIFILSEEYITTFNTNNQRTNFNMKNYDMSGVLQSETSTEYSYVGNITTGIYKSGIPLVNESKEILTVVNNKYISGYRFHGTA